VTTGPPAAEPGFEEFRRLAEEYTVIPVWREVFGDIFTPIVAFDKLASGTGSVLLESADSQERWGRFSFIGAESFGCLVVRGLNVEWEGSHAPIVDLPDGDEGAGGVRAVLDRLVQRLRAPHLPGMPPLFAGAIGFIGHDALDPSWRPAAETPDHVDAILTFPRVILVFDHFRHTIRLIVNVLVDTDTDPQAAYEQGVAHLDELAASLATTPSTLRAMAIPETSARNELEADVTTDEFAATLERGLARVTAGEVRQLGLSRRFWRRTPADPLTVYRMLRTLNPSPYMYLMRLPGIVIVGSSPQVLVRVRDGQVTTCPIGGTFRRTGDPVTDEALARSLLVDAKGQAEHQMLVELAVDDLAEVCREGSIELTRGTEVVHYSRVMHLATELVGELAPGRSPLDALAASFPAGTVCGTPRRRAIEIARELEPRPRTVYGGAVGYVDFSGNLDTCIAIRTIVFRDGVAYCQAGASVVVDSVIKEEVHEAQAKAQGLADAIAAAERATYV
jgi:anthranilate synthase component 1